MCDAFGNRLATNVFINKDLRERFQFWTFSYPTADPFPSESLKLRRQLIQLRKHVDPDLTDVTLDNIVLIGHRMRGLLASVVGSGHWP